MILENKECHGRSIPRPGWPPPKPIPGQELFPERAAAIVNAASRSELVFACWRYVGAHWFARYAAGRHLDLAFEVVLGDVLGLVRQSKVRPGMPKRFFVRLVSAAGDAVGAIF